MRSCVLFCDFVENYWVMSIRTISKILGIAVVAAAYENVVAANYDVSTERIGGMQYRNITDFKDECRNICSSCRNIDEFENSWGLFIESDELFDAYLFIVTYLREFCYADFELYFVKWIERKEQKTRLK